MHKFFSDRIQELHSITWPTRKQATTAAITVLTIMLIVGFAISFTDTGFNWLMLKGIPSVLVP